MRKAAIGAAAAAGAAINYLMDPERGARRRAIVRDKMVRAGNVAADAFGATGRDARNRGFGIGARARRLVTSDRPDDRVLEERVREALGRAISHPGPIQVTAMDGCVTLSGPVLERDVEALMRTVRRVGGVRDIEDQLDVHRTAGNIPALQGEGRIQSRNRERWSPSKRMTYTAGGAGMLAGGLMRRGFTGTLMGLTGTAAIVRALLNKPAKQITGVGANRRAVDVQKTIRIDAPAEQIYDYWRHLENLPEFMTHVREVRPNADGTYHWVVDGPAGSAAEWDAMITDEEPERMLAWRSQPGSAIQNAGIVRFTPVDGQTEVDVQLSYNPPGGELGHAAAVLFGVDPKRQMDDDLMRLKSTIETGRPPRDAGTRRI